MLQSFRGGYQIEVSFILHQIWGSSAAGCGREPWGHQVEQLAKFVSLATTSLSCHDPQARQECRRSRCALQLVCILAGLARSCSNHVPSCLWISSKWLVKILMLWYLAVHRVSHMETFYTRLRLLGLSRKNLRTSAMELRSFTTRLSLWTAQWTKAALGILLLDLSLYSANFTSHGWASILSLAKWLCEILAGLSSIVY